MILKRIFLFITVLAFVACVATKQKMEMKTVVQLGHSSAVATIAFSPDSRFILSGSNDRTIKLWEVSSGREIRTFRGIDADVTAVAYSPDGRIALAGYMNGRLAFWEVSTGRKIRSFKAHSSWIQEVAFSPDGKKAISGSSNRNVKVWRVSSGARIGSVRGSRVRGQNWSNTTVAFSLDGRFALLGSKDTQLWNLEKRQKILNLPSRFASGQFGNEVNDSTFSPDGRLFLLGGNGLELREISTGREIQTFKGRTYRIQTVAYSPDGQFIMTGHKDGALTLWNVSTGREIRSFAKQNTSIHQIIFSPNGRFVLTGNNDGTMTLWEVSSGRKIRIFKGSSLKVRAVAYSPADSLAVSGTDNGNLALWDVATGQGVKIFRGHRKAISSVAFSPNGRHVLSGSDDRTVKLWDVFNGEINQTFRGHTDAVTSVAFSPNHQFALSGSKDETIKLWEISTGKEIRTFKGHSHWVNSVSFSPNGQLALSGSSDNKLKLWEIATGREIRTFDGDTGWILSTAFSPDGQFALSGSWQDLTLWKVSSGRKIRTIKAHSGNITSVAFSYDGRHFLSGSDDNQIKLWNVSTGKEVKSFKGHLGEVHAVGFSASGHHVISGSSDATTKIWNIKTGRDACRFISFDDGEWIAIIPEGYFNASPNGSKHLNVHYGMNVYSIDQLYEHLYRPDLVHAKLGGDPKDLVAETASKINLASLLLAGPAPNVAFVSPQSGVVQERDIYVKILLIDQGGGIGKAIWKLNGRTKGVDEKGKAIRIEKSKPTLHLSKLLTLSSGQNTLEVIVYNSEETIASDPTVLMLDLQDKSSEKPKLYILSVGINRYRDRALWLNYAVPDARSVAETLKATARTIFTDTQVTELYDDQVTVTGLSQAFEAIAAQDNTNDVFILYLSGHGITLDGRYHFIPVDFRYYNQEAVNRQAVTQDHLQKWMASLDAEKSLVLLDTCNSGSYVEAQAVARGMAEKTAIDKLTRATGRATIAASSEAQVALEGYQGHGVFTYALLDALVHSDRLYGNRDGVINTNEIASFVQDKVPEMSYEKWGYEQIPQINLHGMSFPVGLSKQH